MLAATAAILTASAVSAQSVRVATYATDDNVEYIPTRMSVSPPDGSLSYWPNPVFIEWGGGFTELVGSDGKKLNENNNISPLDLSYWSVTLNGEPCDLSERGDFDDFMVYYAPFSNEQVGGTDMTPAWHVKFYPYSALTEPMPGDRTGTIRTPKLGTVEITMLPGAVYDTEGRTNPLTVITYYQYGMLTTIVPTWTPESGAAKFEEGTGALYVEWIEYKYTPDGQKTDEIIGVCPVLKLNPNPIKESFIDNSDATDESSRGRTSIQNLLSVEEGKLKVDVSSLKPGKYDIDIEEGTVFFEDDKIAMATYYTFQILPKEDDQPERPVEPGPVEPGDDITYTLLPADGATVTDLMTVNISFPDNDNVVFYENNKMPVATLTNTTNGKVYYCQEADRDTHSTVKGVSYTLVFIAEDAETAAPITEQGVYELSITALKVTDAEGEIERDLDPIKAVYTIMEGGNNDDPDEPVKPTPGPDDGVDGIEADANGLFTVYNLQGVKVLVTTESAELDTLRGLYIVNGRKVMLGK